MIDDKKDILLTEYQIVTDKINMLVNYDLKIMNIGLIIFGVGFGYGMSESVNNSILLIFFPFAIYIVLLFAIHVYIIVTALCGYKKCIEEYINKNYMGFHFMLCESINEKFTFKSVALFGSYLFYSALLIIGIYKSIQEAKLTFDVFRINAIIIAHAASITLIGYSGYKFVTTMKESYNFAKDKFARKFE